MKMKDKPQEKQYIIYSRKSKFTGKGESIENQIELCRQYIAMHFGEEAAENVLVYEDFSGGNLERPQFKKMMKDSQKIAFAAIVVYRLDRISRNIGDFAECAEFDGEHGIMVYNRSLQRPGKANQIRPMEEWIVAVGKHPGIIAGSDWVRVQAMLDVNKSKSYRRPRSNVALLSGLLRCGECGDYMRPKLTNRKNADGELIYTYMCSTKERSHGTVCAMKNCNGNTLDAKIIEEIRKLSADKETLARLLTQTKKVISGSKEGYDAELALLKEKHTETEDRIKRLVEFLSVASDTSAKYVMEQIDALHQESETQQMRLAELEALTEQSRMLHQEFAFHQEMIESFASAVDSATLEEKRRLLRTIVKKVVWDGKNAYVYLFAEDGEADLPPIDQPMYPLGEDSESDSSGCQCETGWETSQGHQLNRVTANGEFPQGNFPSLSLKPILP